jgi:hypothetical protein
MEKWKPVAPQLYAEFEQYTFEAFRALSQKPNPPIELLKEVTTTESSVAIALVQTPAWGRLIADAEHELQSLPSYRALQQFLCNDERTLKHARTLQHRGDGSPLTNEDLSRFFDWHVITRFLLNYLDGERSCQFEEGRFALVYQPHEEWLMTNQQTVQTIAMLSSFVGPEEPFTIDQGITLRKANDRDFSELVRRTDQQYREFSSKRWMLEIETVVPKLSGVADPRAIKSIQDILGAIRLTKKGGAYCTNVLSKRMQDTSQSSLLQLPASHVPSVSQFELREDISAFLQSYEGIRSIRPTSPLEFPFRQFNYSYERTRVEDRVIDLVIALEALFVRDGGSGEIGYKFRMRLARFLSSRDYTSQEVAEIAKNAYDMRSAIVHGNPAGQQKIYGKLRAVGIANLDALAERVEEYARRSIQILLQDITAADPKRLDSLLLSRD